ncbi:MULTISPECIES: hypothetical protein [Paenibacillus]|uniref:Uncharacterized protein n=1 Tax=Paenibacillus borealis TaxID=160799 RepID=A0ABX3H9T4_PAEBO|nr:hypothetical protein [Paenibacillus borealis]OMD47247.1 hypothetical protein BSK56_13775 [Paenibacillus borealis]
MSVELNISYLKQHRYPGISIPSPMQKQTSVVRVESERVVFIHGGEERWIIDPKFFDGKPKLKVHNTSHNKIEITLKDAYFPGTDILADLICEVYSDEGREMMNLKMDLGLNNYDVILDDWLAGEQPLSGWSVFNNTTVCHFGIHGELSFNGLVSTRFFPNWIVHLKGEQGLDVAAFNVMGIPVYSGNIVFGVPSLSHASLFNIKPERRTIFSLQSVHKYLPGSLIHMIDLPDGWTMLSTNQPYDDLHIEASISQKGNKEQAFIIQTNQGDIDKWVLNFQNSQKFAFPLHNVMYAMGFDGKTIHAMQFGKFNTKPKWYHLSGSSLLLGDGTDAKFELIARNKRIESALVAPALFSFAAPLEGLVIDIIPANPFKVLGIYPTGSGRHPGFAETEKLGLPALQINPKLPSPVLTMSDLSFSLLRTKDLLLLRFKFENFAFQTGGGKRAHLERLSTDTPAYMAVHFPPQHIAEQVFEEKEINNNKHSEPPVSARMSGPSRLVFRIPENVRELQYTLETLLNWSSYEQSVVPTAMPSPVSPNLLLTRLTGYNLDETHPLLLPELLPDEKVAPKAEHTAIEAPYRLILSPNWFGGWNHVFYPATFLGLTELWHTRLGVRTKDGIDEQESFLRTVRAVWNMDQAPPPKFTMSLNEKNRSDIVKNSLEFKNAIQVNRMMLSSLGIWLDLDGSWQVGPPNLSKWIHRSAMGRDNFVKIVYEGYLFPFGHRASMITFTERRCEASPLNKDMIAYLVSWTIVVVREPERYFPVPGMPNEGRQLPFRRIRLKTLQTPPLNKVRLPWLSVDENDFLFHVEGEDQEGRLIEFTTPLAFVESICQTLIDDFNTKPDNLTRRTRSMDGQKVAFAPTNQPGNTSFTVKTMSFEADKNCELPGFYPVIAAADVNIPAADQIAGVNNSYLNSADNSITVEYHQTYLQESFNTTFNPGEVFFELPDQVRKDFPIDKVGGIVTPNFNINGLSRTYGPVADAKIQKWLEPDKILGDAKLMGGILLKDIVEIVNIFESPGSIPKMTTRVIYPKVNGKEDTNAIPEAIETRYMFEPVLKSDDKKLFEVMNNSTMKLTTLMTTTSSKSTYDVTGELRNFKVNLIGTSPTTQFLILHFSQLTFNARSGQKPVVTPVIKNVEFSGSLQFVTNLQDFLKSIKEDSGINVTPLGVAVSTSLAIPKVSLGILSLENLTFISRFLLPFDGTPATFYFAFASRENPFLLTVGTFGGGGFFGIMLSLDPKNPIKLLEASLEFGGNQVLDLGVASGGIYLMAGIYYRMENDFQNNQICQLTGYVRCGGSLQVLGLVTVSTEFYLSLNYRDPGVAWGQATVTVKIKLLLHSKKVNLTMEKQFAGSGDNRLIDEMITEEDWSEYCDAFA